jgi:hypothetical protein
MIFLTFVVLIILNEINFDSSLLAANINTRLQHPATNVNTI